MALNWRTWIVGALYLRKVDLNGHKYIHISIIHKAQNGRMNKKKDDIDFIYYSTDDDDDNEGESN